MVGLTAPGDRLRAAGVVAERLPRQHLGEVRADRVGVGRLGLRGGLGADLGGLEEDDRVVLVERVALRAETARTTPPPGAATRCSIFIASRTAICWPGRTASPSATSIDTTVPCKGAQTATVPSGPSRAFARASPASASGASK